MSEELPTCDVCGSYLRLGKCPYPTNWAHEAADLRAQLALAAAVVEAAEKYKAAAGRAIGTGEYVDALIVQDAGDRLDAALAAYRDAGGRS